MEVDFIRIERIERRWFRMRRFSEIRRVVGGVVVEVKILVFFFFYMKYFYYLKIFK